MPVDTPLPRVMHLRSSCGFYGAEGVIDSLVHEYPGDSVVALLADSRGVHTELSDHLAAQGWDAIAINTHGAVDPLVLRRFAGAVRRYRPDVIHCHDYKSAAIAAIVVRDLHRRLVFTVHGDLRKTVRSQALIKIAHLALRRFHSVIAVSDAAIDDAQEYGVDPKRIHFILNAVDTQRFQPGGDKIAARLALGLPADGFLIGTVSRMAEEKAHRVTLDAVSRLKMPWRLVLAGTGPLESDLRQQAKALGITDRTHFLGRVENIERVFHALDVLAQPSFHEGLPLAVVEATACGVPIVATGVGDVPKIVIDGKTGILVPMDDPDALSTALTRLADDAELRQAYSMAGRAHAVERFGREAMAKSYEIIYREAAKR